MNNEFDSLRDWLMQAAARWDGHPRVDRALTTYWRAEDTDAHRAASRVWLLSLAARGLQGGVKVDTCPIFIGGQGVRKSSSFRALVGDEWFAESPLPIGDKDAQQTLRGKWLWEFPEARSLFRGRDIESAKAYISTQSDTFRASYGRHTEDVPRRTVFVASVNDTEILSDSTGNRRFPIVRVGALIDNEAIVRDREQLLGEAAARVLSDEQWWPTAEEDAALDAGRSDHEIQDPWVPLIGAWLAKRESKGRGAEGFSIADVCSPVSGAIEIHASQLDQRVSRRVSDALRALGCERRQNRSRGPTRGQRLWWAQGNTMGTRVSA